MAALAAVAGVPAVATVAAPSVVRLLCKDSTAVTHHQEHLGRFLKVPNQGLLSQRL